VEESVLKILQEHDLPFVLLNYRFKGVILIPWLLDDFGGIYNLVNYLLKLGHKRIGFISEEADEPSFNERYRGYTEALKDSHIQIDLKL